MMGSTDVQVRYVANAGLVLETDGIGMGIDIFARDPHGLYPDTPPELGQELLEEIAAGKIQVLLFTHGHGDHFCMEAVVEAWKRNPDLCILSTEQVIQRLGQAGLPEGQEMKALRVKGLPPGLWAIPDGEKEKHLRWVEMGAFHIGFLNTLHEGEQYAGEQNLTLLLEVQGRRLVVPGDAAPRESLFLNIANWSKEIDCFFLPFPYVGIRSTRKLLKETLEIRKAFVLHQPKPEADTQNWIGSAKLMCQRSTDELIQPYFPEKLGVWWEL